MALENARKALGQLFIIGFNGLELSDETSAFLSQARIGGVILFANNYDSPGQVAELINQIQESRSDNPLWIGVDHEGGRVQRFKKGFTKIPDAAAIGAANSPKLAFEIAEMMAKELKAVGVNLNFCPVADILTNSKNQVIGNRAFGNTEAAVSKFITGIIRGHLVTGVQPCVKHFPGHGDSLADSHLMLPKVDTPIEVLRERELRPFGKACKSRCGMIMTAHIVCTAIDPDKPATLSSKILQNILRDDMRFSGVIVTDDLEMQAITDNFGAEDAPRLALQAGCDMLLYKTEAAARHSYASLQKALEEGKLDPAIVLQAEARIRALKESILPETYAPVAVSELAQKVGTPEHLALVERLNQG